MTMLIPLLLRLTALFERGRPIEEPSAEAQLFSEELPATAPEKE